MPKRRIKKIKSNPKAELWGIKVSHEHDKRTFL